jgi:hypothetical protein
MSTSNFLVMAKYSFCLWTLMVFFAVSNCFSQPSPALLHRAEKTLTKTIVHDIFSPPVASRIYLYANAAAYEALIPGNAVYRSLEGQIRNFPKMKLVVPDKRINYELASVYAFLKTGGSMVFSEHLLKDSVTAILRDFKETDQDVYTNSIEFGKMVSDSILKWALGDNYVLTRKKRRYSYSKEIGKWKPTPPGYIDAVEPYWSQIRPVALDSAAEFKPVPPPAFSVDSTSLFMKDVKEVYNVTRNMSKEQILIASFWDCNPFYLNTQGHLNFATKKLSPGGHWMSIAGQAAEISGADWPTTVSAYFLTSVALFDGFISCWDEKYRSQLIRPETVINAYINERWRPLLQTPPFPEYTSGHSVISTAAAEVLTSIFGAKFQFDDKTEVDYGLPVRHFSSFRAAADEAAISRLYGGIHYSTAIVNGQIQGRNIADKVLKRFSLK